MNNSSVTTSSMSWFFSYIYTVEGLVVAVFCTALALSIFSDAKLRGQKEYVIIAGSAAFDALFGLGYTGAGIWRLFIYYSETFSAPVANQQSAKEPVQLLRLSRSGRPAVESSPRHLSASSGSILRRVQAALEPMEEVSQRKHPEHHRISLSVL
uniref:Uncharacterized protein n=1 Tax=Ditylenchus dipsaci TaxID=166011 RepID=A0A915D945_9BILA